MDIYEINCKSTQDSYTISINNINEFPMSRKLQIS